MSRYTVAPKPFVPVTDAEAMERTRSRAPVAAPGKRHRQPPVQEPIDERMGETEGKQAGQKSMKRAWRGGRIH